MFLITRRNFIMETWDRIRADRSRSVLLKTRIELIARCMFPHSCLSCVYFSPDGSIPRGKRWDPYAAIIIRKSSRRFPPVKWNFQIVLMYFPAHFVFLLNVVSILSVVCLLADLSSDCRLLLPPFTYIGLFFRATSQMQFIGWLRSDILHNHQFI